MEQFDQVNEHDNVVGVTDKNTAHASRLPHRVVAVYVFNNDGELYLQAHKKSDGKYDHSVGGHVLKGEDYATAAVREAEEELGIRQSLIHVSTFFSKNGKYRHMFGIFECIAEPSWQFTPNDEVEKIIPMKLEDIRRLMKTNPERFTGGFINTMQEYCKVKRL